jgi:hypothetical protein
MTVTTEDNGTQNMWAKEPDSYIDPKIQEQMKDGIYETHNERAERLNGRLAMCGIMLAFASYFTTGTLAFGLF